MQDDVRAILDQAIELHQSGELQGAEPLYRRVLELIPDHVDTQYLLGVVHLQSGKFDESIEILNRVVAARPDVPDAHNNLGVAYKALGQWEPAARAFQLAIKANPEYEQAFFNLGALMEDRKLFADAEKCYRQALSLNPNDQQTRCRLGDALKAQEQWASAETCYREILSAEPDNLDIVINLGFVLVRQERLDEAIELYEHILVTKPDYAEIHNNCSYVFERKGMLEMAVESARRAVDIQPNYAEGYNNLGTALCSLKRLDEACQSFQKAFELSPEFALAEFNFGTTKLLAGEYLRGWAGYRRHADVLDLSTRSFSEARWNGGEIPGQRLLVFADQGFGDTIQFIRFLPQVKQRTNAEIIFECPDELLKLLSGQIAADRVLAEGAPLPGFEFQVPLTDLPAILQVTLKNVPAADGYLTDPQPMSAGIEACIEQADPANMKVGLVWKGNPQQPRDHLRSCPAEKLLPLFDIPGISWFSMQTELGDDLSEQITQNKLTDLGSQLSNFQETAAAIARLDLIVTVDTATAHLAGALGQSVWTMLADVADWRWHLCRTDSPWYSSMRLFRQPQWGDWDGLIADVTSELRQLVEKTPSRG